VRRRELRRVARVEQLRAVAHRGGDLVDRQRLELARERLLERRPLAAVQHRVVGEVRRRVGLVGRHQIDER